VQQHSLGYGNNDKLAYVMASKNINRWGWRPWFIQSKSDLFTVRH